MKKIRILLLHVMLCSGLSLVLLTVISYLSFEVSSRVGLNTDKNILETSSVQKSSNKSSWDSARERIAIQIPAPWKPMLWLFLWFQFHGQKVVKQTDNASYSLCNDVNCPRVLGIVPLKKLKERSLSFGLYMYFMSQWRKRTIKKAIEDEKKLMCFTLLSKNWTTQHLGALSS